MSTTTPAVTTDTATIVITKEDTMNDQPTTTPDESGRSGSVRRPVRWWRLVAFGAMLIALTLGGMAATTDGTAEAHGAGANGCTLSPDSLSWPVYYNFHHQCDRHDWCYDQLWFGGGYWGRLGCDNMFHREMRSWCAGQYRWNLPARYACYGVAATYYTAVRKFGGPYFNNPWLN
ncbi:MAG: phospholipase A2 [Desertimonas sp.]